jgi:acyl carrier protein
MELEAIKTKIKEAIQQVTGVDAADISDTASYIEDLDLDSLAILEIAVAVESQFKFQASDEELSSIRTVEDTIALVKRRLFAEVA